MESSFHRVDKLIAQAKESFKKAFNKEPRPYRPPLTLKQIAEQLNQIYVPVIKREMGKPSQFALMFQEEIATIQQEKSA